MNRRAGRLGDQSRSRDTVGPAVTAAAHVAINRRRALRVADEGTAAGASWVARIGAARVLVGGKPLHRMGDVTTHGACDGVLVEGSANVLVGDARSGEECASGSWGVRFVIHDPFGRPRRRARVEIRLEDGSRRELTLDEDGGAMICPVPKGRYFVRIIGVG